MRVRFSAPVQTGPSAHPASYTMGTGSFQGVKRQERGVDHPPPSTAEVKERVEHLYFPSGHSWHVRGQTLPLPLPFCSLYYTVDRTDPRNCARDMKKMLACLLESIFCVSVITPSSSFHKFLSLFYFPLPDFPQSAITSNFLPSHIPSTSPSIFLVTLFYRSDTSAVETSSRKWSNQLRVYSPSFLHFSRPSLIAQTNISLLVSFKLIFDRLPAETHAFTSQNCQHFSGTTLPPPPPPPTHTHTHIRCTFSLEFQVYTGGILQDHRSVQRKNKWGCQKELPLCSFFSQDTLEGEENIGALQVTFLAELSFSYKLHLYAYTPVISQY